MNRNFDFVKLVFQPSADGDYTCRDGEVESCVVSADGAWIDPDQVKGRGVGDETDTPPVVSESLLPLPLGEASGVSLPELPEFLADLPKEAPDGPCLRLLCRHPLGDDDSSCNYIYLRSDGTVLFAHESTPKAVRAITALGQVSDVRQSLVSGPYLILLLPDGVRYLRWNRPALSYELIDILGNLPVVEFSLTRRPVAPYSLLPSQWPTTEVTVPVAESDENFNELLMQATEEFLSDYERRAMQLGLSTTPFMAMAAMVLPDGSRLPMGPPVLMIPNSEAPIVEVETVGGNQYATGVSLRIRGASCALKMRLLSDKGFPSFPDYVSRIEILMAGPVSLRSSGPYKPTAPRSLPSDGFSVTESGESPLSDGTRIRGLSPGAYPRETIEASIAMLSDFRMVASISPDSIPLSAVAFPVPLLPGALASETEASSVSPDFSSLTRRIPYRLAAVNSRLIALGGKFQLPDIIPIRGCSASSGGTRDWSVSVVVEGEKDGMTVRSILNPQPLSGVYSPHMVCAPEESFPRWLFYPEPDAKYILLKLTRGTETRRYRLPLIPHPTLHGSYWFRGFGDTLPDEYTPDETDSTPNESDTYPANNIASVSADGIPFLFKRSGIVSCGQARVLDAVQSVRSLSSGQLGMFPLQIFTDEGIWAVAMEETGAFRAVQPVSLHRCVNPEATLPTPSGTLFVTKSGLKLLNGTKVSDLSSDCPPSLSPSFLSACRSWYDYTQDHLHVFIPGERDTDVYCLATGKWLGKCELKPLYVAGDMIVPDSSVFLRNDDMWILPGGTQLKPGTLPGEVPVLPGQIVSGGERCWQVTLRPLKMNTPHNRKRLRGVGLIGPETENACIRLWGAMRPGVWHPLAEGSSPLRSLAGSAWRYYRVSLLFRAPHPSAAEGLLLRRE